ncbi:sensor domain-containing protein [Halobellus sp. MBLA0160]|uniref:Sensor domain-containing protein n=1 Tax=Halobellus ruber TaxID=2761102 RepID=A0A7J9SKI5_9EURY|nr:sensor domain-containing protein [Halobellus ruber]
MSVIPSLPSLQSLAAAPVRARTYRHLLYLGLMFPLGIVYFVVLVVGFSISASLVVLLVGLPLLALTLLLVRGFAAVERRLANRLLDADIATPAYPFRSGSVSERVRALLVNRRTWLECGYLLSKFPAGIGAFVLLVTGLTTSLAFIATPAYYDTPGGRVGVFLADPLTVSPSLSVPWGDVLVGIEFAVTVSDWAVDSLGDALAFSVLGAVSLLVTLNLTNLAAWLFRRYTQALLGDPAAARISES